MGYRPKIKTIHVIAALVMVLLALVVGFIGAVLAEKYNMPWLTYLLLAVIIVIALTLFFRSDLAKSLPKKRR